MEDLKKDDAIQYSDVPESELTEMISITMICRLCANQSNKLITIFGEDGIANDLANKMNLYLPIKVSETDELPLQCCWQCASTVLAWHELIITSLEADRRFKNYQYIDKKVAVVNEPHLVDVSDSVSENNAENEIVDYNLEELDQTEVCSVKGSSTFNIKNELKVPEKKVVRITKNVRRSKGSNNKNMPTLNKKATNVSNKTRRFVDNNDQKCEPFSQNLVDTFACCICPTIFLNQEDVVAHIESEHKPEFLEIVELDGAKLNVASSSDNYDQLVFKLNNSSQVTIDEKSLYTCTKCGLIFHYKYALLWHLILHFKKQSGALKLNDTNENKSEHQVNDQSVVYHIEPFQDTITFNMNVPLALSANTETSNDKCQNYDLPQVIKDNKGAVESDDQINEPLVKKLGNDAVDELMDVGSEDNVSDANDEFTDGLEEANEEQMNERDRKNSVDYYANEGVVRKRSFMYECPYCPETQQTLKKLHQHLIKNHAVDKDDLSFEDENGALKKPKRKHNKIDQDLVNKAKVLIDGKVYYKCKNCGKSLHSPYTYVWHIRIHTGERPFICDLCGKQFRVSQGLTRHLKETHEKIKTFPCDLCGRMFGTRRNVEEHRRIHTNERPYVCAICGKSFKQKASLFVHNRSHGTSFPFKCTYCEQAFRTKPPLLIHLTRHTGEKPYYCDVCGRAFRINYELKRHKLIHSEEKPYCCDICGAKFRQKRYLKNHIKANHSTLKDPSNQL